MAELSSVVSEETGKSIHEAPPQLVAALFENHLEEEVLLAASPDPTDHSLPLPARSARARDLLATLCPSPSPPSEAEIDAYIAQHHSGQSTTERILLRQLILPDLPTARTAIDRIRRGEAFASVSKDLSRAPNAAEGGMLGWVERGQLPPEFEAAVFGLGPGDLSQPVESNAGWHVFQVVDRRTGIGPNDPQLRARVRMLLASRAAERSRTLCLQRLAARVGVHVNCEGVSFPCRNPFEEK